MPPRYITSAADLKTSHESTVEGFLVQSLEKTSKASTFLATGDKFRNILEASVAINTLNKPDSDPIRHAAQVETVVSSLLANAESRAGIIGAAGLSQKACEHLTDPEIDTSVKSVLSILAFGSADEFRRKIYDRFMLNQGDALGGQMRNFIGAEAGRKLTNALTDALRLAGVIPTLTIS